MLILSMHFVGSVSRVAFLCIGADGSILNLRKCHGAAADLVEDRQTFGDLLSPESQCAYDGFHWLGIGTEPRLVPSRSALLLYHWRLI